MAEEKPKPLAMLKKFFGTPERPVSNEEFTEFWGTLSEKEKADFKRQILEK